MEIDAQKSKSSVGYFQVIKQNRNFRHLWYGHLVSSFGDWLSAAALYSLVEVLTGSGRAVAFVVVLQLIPFFVLGPISGLLSDRISRRTIMIFSDIARSITVLFLLFVKRPDQVWLIYVVIGLTESLSALFEPAQQATVPTICKREELFSANGLSALTWSLAVMTGAALGSLFTFMLGRQATFIFNSISFLLSALFISRVKFNKTEVAQSDLIAVQKNKTAIHLGLFQMYEGLRYILQRPAIMSFMFVKIASGLGGGILILLALFGQRVFPIGQGGTAVGLLYTARGLGTALGPLLMRRMGGVNSRALRIGIAWSFLIYGVFYIALGLSTNIFIAMCCLVIAHIGGSIQWVNSTMLLQLSVPNEYRGRVFAWDLGFLTLAASASNYVVGWFIDVAKYSPRQMAIYLGGYLLIPAIVWMFLQVWLKDSYMNVQKLETDVKPESLADAA